MAIVIGLDVGGTKISGVAINQDGTVMTSFSRASDFCGTDYLENVAEVIRHLRAETPGKIDGIGIGVPGTVDYQSGVVRTCPAFKWKDIPLQKMLERIFRVPVCVENDVNAWITAEKYMGAARECESFVMITMGTGLGCGLWLDGKLYHGSSCESGEIGYMPLGIKAYERPFHENDFGYFERIASANAVCETYFKRTAQKLDSRQIFERARNGDSVAGQVVREAFDYLGIGIGCIACLLNPEMVVLGGGMANEGEKLAYELQKRINRLVPIHTGVVLTQVGKYGGAMGAALCYVYRGSGLCGFTRRQNESSTGAL